MLVPVGLLGAVGQMAAMPAPAEMARARRKERIEREEGEGECQAFDGGGGSPSTFG